MLYDKAVNSFLLYSASRNVVAVEIYEGFNLKWTHRYNIDITKDDEYFIEVANQIINDMQNCEHYKDYVESDKDDSNLPTYYDNILDTIILLKFTNGCFSICRKNELGDKITNVLARKWINEAELQGHYDIYDGYALCTSEVMISNQKDWSDCDYDKEKDFTVAPFWLCTDRRTIAINNEDDIVHILREDNWSYL